MEKSQDCPALGPRFHAELICHNKKHQLINWIHVTIIQQRVITKLAHPSPHPFGQRVTR
jgi:hypothetical protein